MAYTVIHNKAGRQFEIVIDGFLAELAYRVRKNSVYDFYHTGVPEELEGKGVGSALVKYGLDYAAKHNWKVNPVCPFVKIYIERHPEYNDLITAL